MRVAGYASSTRLSAAHSAATELLPPHGASRNALTNDCSDLHVSRLQHGRHRSCVPCNGTRSGCASNKRNRVLRQHAAQCRPEHHRQATASRRLLEHIRRALRRVSNGGASLLRHRRPRVYGPLQGQSAREWMQVQAESQLEEGFSKRDGPQLQRHRKSPFNAPCRGCSGSRAKCVQGAMGRRPQASPLRLSKHIGPPLQAFIAGNSLARLKSAVRGHGSRRRAEVLHCCSGSRARRERRRRGPLGVCHAKASLPQAMWAPRVSVPPSLALPRPPTCGDASSGRHGGLLGRLITKGNAGPLVLVRRA